jgi:hypothetical protein
LRERGPPRNGPIARKFHQRKGQARETGQTEPLGVKGCGEAGAIAEPVALASAVLDAFSPLGMTSIDMPVTAVKIWRVIQAYNPIPLWAGQRRYSLSGAADAHMRRRFAR